MRIRAKIKTETIASEQPPLILDVRNLTKYYRTPLHLSKNNRKRFTAVEDVSLSVGIQDFVALVGGSGAGKSTVAKMVLGLEKPDLGSINFHGRSLDSFGRNEYKKFRRGCQAVFQDPKAALSPRMRVANLMEEPLMAHGLGNSEQRHSLALAMLEKVGLGAKYMDRLPHELSGGEAQRVNIARALTAAPQLLICDEPTANLDVFTESEIMQLIVNLMAASNLSLLFITHNISLVRRVAKKVAVMYSGKIVEFGNAKAVCANPVHPYSQYLISFSDPLSNIHTPAMNENTKLTSPEAQPAIGCDFSHLCQYVSERCLSEKPHMVEIESGHKVACWHNGSNRSQC